MRCSLSAVFLLLISVCLSPVAEAQLFKARRAAPGEHPPKVLLVELFTRRNKINYLTSLKKDKMARDVEADVRMVIEKTVADFTDNYSFTPVYYFIDTLADKIQNHEYAGVVLDEKLQPVARPILADGDTAIYILTFGNYVPQPESTNEKYTESNNLGGNREHYGDETSALSPTVLVMNHRFQLLREDQPRTCGRGYSSNRKYKYNGRYHFYRPCARAYDAALRKYFSPRRIY